MKTKQHITTALSILIILSSQIGMSKNLAPDVKGKNIEIAVNADSGISSLNDEDTLNKIMAMNATLVDSIVSSYFKGIDDADKRYNAHKSGKRAIFFTSLVGGPVTSLIPAIVTSSKAPAPANMHIDDYIMIHDLAYIKGYKYESHCIKKKAIWGNYIAGSVVWVAIVLFL
jgi:hypothetical protein